jgi:antirestriction protein ArdC
VEKSRERMCPVRTHGFSAYYSPSLDEITMPAKETFKNSEFYFSVLFHEMTHATGHKARLNREGVSNPSKFGSKLYSPEELIAELGAAFLSNEAGILRPDLFDNSAAYLASWISALKADSRLLLHAASAAQHAADFILGEKE